MKLGTKINLILVAVVAVTLVVAFGVIITLEGRAIEREIRTDVGTVTELVMLDTSRLFNQITKQKEFLQQAISNIAKNIPSVKYIEVVDTKGNIIATTRGEQRTPASESSKLAAVQEILDKKAPLYERKTSGTQHSLEYHAPIFDNKNNIINVVEIEVSVPSFSDKDIAEAMRSLEFSSVSVEQGTRAINLAIEDELSEAQSIVNESSQLGKVDQSSMYGFFYDIAIFDENLKLLANTENDPEEFDKGDPGDAQKRREVLAGTKESYEYDGTYEGRDVIVNIKPIKVSSTDDMNNMRVAGVIETRTLKSAYQDRINELKVSMFIVGFVFTGVLVIVLAIILERQVVGPIRRYSIVARKIAEGDLNQKVEHKSKDEIGEFGNVFNSMVWNLRELDKMKSDFISVAAHQLRTPLAGIKWVLKLLLDGDLGAVNDEQKGMIERGFETSGKMAQLVDDLLNVSRIENGKYGYKIEKNNFMDLLKTLMDNTVLPSKERNIDVRLENHAGEIPDFSFDKEKLLTAIQNIVDNAMKYTLPGGRVTISVEKKGDYVEVKVADTGVGIPKAEIPKLFSKFFRAANVIHLQTEGSGLGLFIVKSIIVRHGGQIWIDSEEGKGTTIAVLVPVLDELLPKEEEVSEESKGETAAS